MKVRMGVLCFRRRLPGLLAQVPTSATAGRPLQTRMSPGFSPLSLPSSLLIGQAKLAAFFFFNLEAESPAVNIGLSDTEVESFANVAPPPPSTPTAPIPRYVQR